MKETELAKAEEILSFYKPKIDKTSCPGADALVALEHLSLLVERNDALRKLGYCTLDGDNLLPLSNSRGHDIVEIEGVFFYRNNMTECAGNPRPDCGHCGKPNTSEGHDGCIGTLEGNVMNACCGHGVESSAYVQFGHKDYLDEPNHHRISGKEAINYINSKRKR